MKWGVLATGLISVVLLWCIWNWKPLEVHAEIASDDAFEGVTWEKIIEDDIEGPKGVIQSMCVTEDYIILIENYDDSAEKSDIIKAYYRNDTDVHGKPWTSIPWQSGWWNETTSMETEWHIIRRPGRSQSPCIPI